MTEAALVTAARLLTLLRRAQPGSTIVTEQGTLTVMDRDGDLLTVRCELVGDGG